MAERKQGSMWDVVISGTTKFTYGEARQKFIWYFEDGTSKLVGEMTEDELMVAVISCLSMLETVYNDLPTIKDYAKVAETLKTFMEGPVG